MTAAQSRMKECYWIDKYIEWSWNKKVINIFYTLLEVRSYSRSEVKFPIVSLRQKVLSWAARQLRETTTRKLIARGANAAKGLIIKLLLNFTFLHCSWVSSIKKFSLHGWNQLLNGSVMSKFDEHFFGEDTNIIGKSLQRETHFSSSSFINNWVNKWRRRRRSYNDKKDSTARIRRQQKCWATIIAALQNVGNSRRISSTRQSAHYALANARNIIQRP